MITKLHGFDTFKESVINTTENYQVNELVTNIAEFIKYNDDDFNDDFFIEVLDEDHSFSGFVFEALLARELKNVESFVDQHFDSIILNLNKEYTREQIIGLIDTWLIDNGKYEDKTESIKTIDVKIPEVIAQGELRNLLERDTTLVNVGKGSFFIGKLKLTESYLESDPMILNLINMYNKIWKEIGALPQFSFNK